MLSVQVRKLVWKLSSFPNNFQTKTTSVQMCALHPCVYVHAHTSFQSVHLGCSCCEASLAITYRMYIDYCITYLLYYMPLQPKSSQTTVEIFISPPGIVHLLLLFINFIRSTYIIIICDWI